jgi:UDP-2,3-diacylglucosamine pyrophosphatase LpxH
LGCKIPAMNYKSIFVSDIHLGTRFSQAEIFLDFLKEIESENLIFVGDIIDGWAIKRKFKWEQSHSDVIQKIGVMKKNERLKPLGNFATMRV